MHRHRHWPIHLILSFISALMLVPFVWVLKTSLTGENIFAYPPSILPKDPHLFYYVDVWYSIPSFNIAVNSVFVFHRGDCHIAFNALAGYAPPGNSLFGKKGSLCLLKLHDDPFQVTIIPAYLITQKLGLLNTHLGMALPVCSTIVCTLSSKRVSTPFLSQPSTRRGSTAFPIEDHLSNHVAAKSAIATNVILAFIWSWNNFLWPLIIIRDDKMQTLPLGLSRFLTVVEDTTGALYAFCVMVLLPGLIIFLLAQKEFIAGLTRGAAKG
jgi:ABC-type glycerol-3-phosphate transport system permease component